MKADKLYLVGFMGAGKTSVARALGRRMGWRVEDIDHRIEAREHQRVAEIFARQGEPYFRSIERAVLQELLAQRHAVVATGGGTFVDAENRAAMLADGAVAWLDVPLERILTRGREDVNDAKAVVYYPHESTPEIVEAHLRADRNLSPETADALSQLFRVAYSQFSRNEPNPPARKRR